MYSRPCAVREHLRSTTLPWASTFKGPAPCLFSNTAGVWAVIVTRRIAWLKRNSWFEVSFFEFVFNWNTVLFSNIQLFAVFVELIASAFEPQGTILRFVLNIPSKNWSMNGVPSNMYIVRFWTIVSQAHAHTCRYPMQMKNSTMPSLVIGLQFTARICHRLNRLMDSFKTCDRKPLLMKFGWGCPVK